MLAFFKMNWDYMRNKSLQQSRRDQAIKEERNVEGKIVIVTGSNSGIGTETALEMAKRGSVVILACRDVEKAEDAKEYILSKISNAQLDVIRLDLGDLSSVREFVKVFKSKYPRLDILINNAGVFMQSLEKTKDGFEMNMGVNHLGHFLLTLLLLDHLEKGAPSRIVCLSSLGSQIANLNLNDLMMEDETTSLGVMNVIPYSNSKLANALFVKELAKKLKKNKENQITCYAVCPGIVNTNLPRNIAWYEKLTTEPLLYLLGLDSNEGAQTTLYCALSDKLDGESGKMYRFRGEWKEIEKYFDEDQARELWTKSQVLVGLEGDFTKYF